MTISPTERSAATFAAVFSRWRADRGMTKKRLAAQMGFDPSYLSHVERGRHRPTADFARRAELVLRAGGAVWQAFVDYDEARSAAARTRHGLVSEHWRPPGPGPVVEQEVASLTYRDGRYRCVVQRRLYNAGTEPLSRWLSRIAVDRYPQDSEQSNAHHRSHPLALPELEFYGLYGDPGEDREPMRWRAKHDRDALKEIWLLFENEARQFPLYPGQRTTIEYGYTVRDDLWGPWFQRAIRLPTGRLAVRVDLPTPPEPQVWGVETSLSTGEAPLRTPVNRRAEPGRAVFEWETEAPPVHARYRLQWRFRPEAGRGTVS
ncbi:helix-turn-helix transcriptional regulator [Natronosporangium hydrolyticum]|uniref:Helix-turn-helix transcriptional regulator n=1 Tax=Natronosporangium hydrolyticum TaxID=2811111 RepID=A0A895YG16_9ACTN|nr:helix-turn-helix transcriptional regulator [Natronosporangium hydrolyticum]QSB14419.1 helix-turn-helix transcriptional regulator [Natronosporangium hydrolyticum]